MFEFKFDESKVAKKIEATNGGFTLLDTGIYNFKITNIGELKQTQKGDSYKTITFREEKSKTTFTEFLTLGVADPSQAWRITNKTEPLIYRLYQVTGVKGSDWEDELLGQRVKLSIVKTTRKRSNALGGDMGEIEVNRLANGSYDKVILPADKKEQTSKEELNKEVLDDLDTFLSDN